MTTVLNGKEIGRIAESPRFLMRDDDQQRPKLAKFQRWYPEGSRYETYERWMEIEKRIKALDLKRKKDQGKNEDQKPLVLMDWGTANGRFLAELSEKLREWDINNVRIIGTSHQYYSNWQSLPKNVELYFGRSDHYASFLYAQDIEVDLIFSHFALFELGLSKSKAKLLRHLSELAPFFHGDTEIVLTGELRNRDVNDPEQELNEIFQGLGFSIEFKRSRYLKKTSRPGRSQSKIQPYPYAVIRPTDRSLKRRRYILLSAEGRFYWSDAPGAFGGYWRGGKKIYGRLDCPSANRWIGQGHYIQYRVFFSKEEDAIEAGFRPCGICMKKN